MKKIDFNNNVNDDEIDGMNDRKVVHSSNDQRNDDYSNIKNHKIYQKQTIRNNSFYTIVNNKLKLKSHLEDPNKTNDWNTTNSHEGELVMAYNNNNGNNTLRPRTFYVLYIGQYKNGNGHLIFKLSMKQILVIMKYQPIYTPEDIIEAINDEDLFNNKIQNNHFDSNHFTLQDDHFENYEDDG